MQLDLAAKDNERHYQLQGDARRFCSGFALSREAGSQEGAKIFGEISGLPE
jgi:hypothetical protein